MSDTVHSRALDGNLLGDTTNRSVIVYLPPGYDSTSVKLRQETYLSDCVFSRFFSESE